MAGCPSWKAWQKKKRQGKVRGNESKPQQRWNRKEISFDGNCRYQDESKFKHNCYHLHAGDQMIIQSGSEEETH